MRWWWFIVLAAACSGERRTSVYVHVEWDGATPIDQLRVSVKAEGVLLAGPALRPETPAGSLAPEQSMRLIVPDALAGRTVEVFLEGLVLGKLRGTVTIPVTLRRASEVEAVVAMTTIGDCADCNGCCSAASVCYTTETTDSGHCGPVGSACVDCGQRGDRCSGGECACGDGPACKKGQRCVGGACVCDAQSCPSGCCAGLTCATRALSRCGAVGAACAACDRVLSDTCSADGACGCGLSEKCDKGKRCRGGVCVCDGVSCPQGCCDKSSACQPGTDKNNCGTGGGQCETCPSNEAGVQQSCTDGVCSGCTQASCPDGCCSGSTCIPSNAERCGTKGKPCRSCDPSLADGCHAEGDCGCGAGPPCTQMQECDSGHCMCTQVSCPQGCCTARAGGECKPGRSSELCGFGGNICAPCPLCDAQTGACLSCNTSNCTNASCCQGATCRRQGQGADGLLCGIGAEACVLCVQGKANACSAAGDCSCGGAAACGTGQVCTSAGCVCNQDSCPGGCCDGTTCKSPPDFTACGTGGEICAACDLRANVCVNGDCACGKNPPCAPGLRCEGLGDTAECVCDTKSGCAGCCADKSTCVRATTAAQCGAQGTSCTQCGQGKSCVNGACKCDQNSCPGGCCRENECLDGDDPSACGGGGAECAICKLQSCVDGACKCDPNSCPNGCCRNNQCLVGTEWNACGSGGNECLICQDRQRQRLSCVDGACKCDPNSCPNGCCRNNQCLRGTDASACGHGGLECADCAVDNGICTGTDVRICACGGGVQSCGDYTQRCATCGKNETCISGACVCENGMRKCGTTCCARGFTCVRNFLGALCQQQL